MSAGVILSALLCVLAGLTVLAAKPLRFTNQTFFITACLAGLWLYCVWRIIRPIQENSSIEQAVIWLRLNGATSVLLAGSVWLLGVSVITNSADAPRILRKSVPLVALAGVLSLACFSEAYISAAPTYYKGPLYFTLAALAHILYAALIIKSWRQLRQCAGIQRVETQFLSLNLASGLFLVVLLTTIGNVFNIGLFRRASVFVFVSAFALSAWAMTFHRIYNARQILTSLAQRIGIIVILCLSTFLIHNGLDRIATSAINLPLSIAISGSCAFWMDRYSRRWFQLEDERDLARMRNCVMEKSRSESKQDVLLHSRLAAEAALKIRVEHLAMMSRGLAHDLKNLITPISSFLIHAEPRIIAGTVEAEVHDSASRSVAIINDYISEALVFGTRLELRLEPTALPALIQTVIDITATRAARRRVAVVSEPLMKDQPHIDRVLVQRMLANLASNAIDASAPGKTVTLSATRVGMDLQFTVADSGSGISAENRARIFEPYFTTKQMGGDARGFGLGLTICEEIVRLHRGSIRVGSEPGRGTTMTVELPSAFAPVRPTAVGGSIPQSEKTPP